MVLFPNKVTFWGTEGEDFIWIWDGGDTIQTLIGSYKVSFIPPFIKFQ